MSNEDEVKAADAKTDEVSKETLAAVAERLRFFFSDANLRQDNFTRRFLWKEDGVVPIESLLKFRTIQQHTTSSKVLIQVVKELTDDTLFVTDDEMAIGRKQAFTKEQMDENVPVSLYITNLPYEDGHYKVTTEQVRALFEKYDGLTLVKLCFRHEYDKNSDKIDEHNKEDTPGSREADTPGSTPDKRHRRFKRIPNGSALVEFDSVEHLDKAAADLVSCGSGKEPSRVLTLSDNTLTVERLQDFKNKKKRKSTEPQDVRENSVTPVTAFEFDWKPGSVISLNGVAESCDREALLRAVAGALGVSVDDVKTLKIYVDYSRGQTYAALRFPEPDDKVKTVSDKISSGDVLVSGAKVESVKILEGDEEKQYWDKFIEFKNKQLRQREDERSSRKKFRKR